MLYIILIGLAVTCIAAIGAKSLIDFSRHDLEEICRRRASQERLGVILSDHKRLALTAETLQVVGTVLAVGGLLLWLLDMRAEDAEGVTTANWAATLCVGAVLLFVAEIWLPWAIARLWAAPFIYYTWPLWKAADVLLTPVVLCARFVDTVLHRLAGRGDETADEDVIEEEIRTIVTEGHREGLLEEDARQLIEGVMELGDLDVSQVMTPRTDMVPIPLAATWEELLESVTKWNHSRYPIFDKTRDDITGVLVMKDLFLEMAKTPDVTRIEWQSLVRKPIFVPETKPIDDLLRDFQVHHSHMVIVLDEYGGVSGLVTLEDVIEEIVGEIIDEHDPEEVEDVNKIDDQTLEALGRVHVGEINDLLDTDLPEDEDYDTIGGFVFSELGHVPEQGEAVVWNDAVRVTVLEATLRRVERVRVEVIEEAK